MKKISTLVLSVLLLAACSNDIQETRPGGDSQTTRVNAKITLPVESSVIYETRAEGDPYKIASVAERKVNNLDLYLFDAVGGVLERVYENLLGGAFNPTDQADSKSISFTVEGENNKTLYFVANASKEAALKEVAVGVTTKTEFLAYLTNIIAGENNQISCDGNNPLVMTTDAAITAPVGDDISLGNLTLKRVVARVDIHNFENNLKINKVTMEGARSASYILPATASYAATAVTLKSNWDFATGTPAVLAAEAPHINAGKGYASVFYPYECAKPLTAANAPYLMVEGILFPSAGNVAAKFKIPFVDENGEPFAIERNKRYIVVINNYYQDQIKASIKVQDWASTTNFTEDTTIDEIKVSLPVADLPAGVTLVSNTLTIPADLENLTLNIASPTAWNVVSTGDVVENSEKLGTSATQFVHTQLKLTFDENTTEKERSSIVTLNSEVDPDYSGKVVYNLIVKQAAAN